MLAGTVAIIPIISWVILLTVWSTHYICCTPDILGSSFTILLCSVFVSLPCYSYFPCLPLYEFIPSFWWSTPKWWSTRSSFMRKSTLKAYFLAPWKYLYSVLRFYWLVENRVLTSIFFYFHSEFYRHYFMVLLLLLMLLKVQVVLINVCDFSPSLEAQKTFPLFPMSEIS